MLHTPSFNLGLAAGHTAVALDHPRPATIDDIPGLDTIMDASDNLDMFFPSSYVEGFTTAYDYPGRKFIALVKG